MGTSSRGRPPAISPHTGPPRRGTRKIAVWLEIGQIAKLDKEETRRRMSGETTINRSQVIRDLVDDNLD